MAKISNEELQAIKERVEKATEGNWRATLDDPYERTYVLGAFNGVVSVIAVIKGDSDAEFIAHARQDVPKLVEALLQERAEVERLKGFEKFLEEISQLFIRVSYGYINSDKYGNEAKQLAEFINDCILDGNPIFIEGESQ